MPNMAQFTLMRHERKGYVNQELTPENVAEFIHRRLGANKAEVAFAFGVSDDSAYRALKKAQKAGRVKLVGRGRAAQWFPTE